MIDLATTNPVHADRRPQSSRTTAWPVSVRGWWALLKGSALAISARRESTP